MQNRHNSSALARELSLLSLATDMETFSRSLALHEGNPLVNSHSPKKGPVIWGFDVFMDAILQKLLNKKSRRWFETPLCWCDVTADTAKNFHALADQKSIFYNFFQF